MCYNGYNIGCTDRGAYDFIMKLKKFSLTTQYLIVFAAFLLIVTFVFGIVLTMQSRASVKSLLSSRMLDIVNTAADMLDGDVLERLHKEDKGTPDYEGQLEKLRVFMNSVSFEYIYCIQAVGEKEFVFSIDPTIEDPGVFGEPVKYTDALYSASKGVAAVDDVPYEDAWGRFYSAYSPVFDSAGKVAAIVAVDFGAEWYDRAVVRNSITVAVIGVLSLLGGACLVLIVTTRIRRRFGKLRKELNDLRDDVGSLTEVFSSSPGFSEVVDQNNAIVAQSEPKDSSNELTVLSAQIDQMHKQLGTYIDYVHSLAYTDAMTGFLNRAAYHEAIARLDERIKDEGFNLCIAVFDLNGLKQANDNYGHEFGDRLLIDSASILKTVFAGDSLYRIGGDEFVILAEGWAAGAFERKLNEIDDAIAQYNAHARTFPLALSKGAAFFDANTDDAYRTIFKRADDAMYKDKAEYYRGKNDRRFHSDH